MAAGAMVDHDPWDFLSKVQAPIEKALPIVSVLTLSAADRVSSRRATAPRTASPTRTEPLRFWRSFRAFPTTSAALITPALSAAFFPTAAKLRSKKPAREKSATSSSATAASATTRCSGCLKRRKVSPPWRRSAKTRSPTGPTHWLSPRQSWKQEDYKKYYEIKRK